MGMANTARGIGANRGAGVVLATVRKCTYLLEFGGVPGSDSRAFPVVLSVFRTPPPPLGASDLLAFLGFLAAVGVAVDGEDFGVVDEPVDKGHEAGGVREEQRITLSLHTVLD